MRALGYINRPSFYPATFFCKNCGRQMDKDKVYTDDFCSDNCEKNFTVEQIDFWKQHKFED